MRKNGLLLALALLLGSVLAAPAAGRAAETFPAVKVAELVKDSVVSIDSNSVAYGSVSFNGAFEQSRSATLSTRRITGFVYTADGYIITDSISIEDAALIVVRTNDGTELTGTVVGTDPFYGIGVIKVDVGKKKLKPVKMVSSIYDPINESYPYGQGDSVVAIGYSGGYGGTVTYGIISGIRNFRNRSKVLIPSMIQADVVINSGNEGCPLFDDQGRVIAVHERRADGGSLQNTTFFLPVWLVKRVADEIISDKNSGQDIEVWHPWLGVRPFAGTRSIFGNQAFNQVGDDLKMYMNIPYDYWDVGVLIDSIYPESPAKEFGLLDKDMLMTVVVKDKKDNTKVPYRYLKSVEELELMVTTAERDDRFIFGVLRKGKLFDVEVIAGQHPGEFAYSGSIGEILSSSDFF